MRAAFLLFPAIAMLAGCNAQPAGPTIAEQEATLRNETAEFKGWDRVFNAPTETIARLNQFGYRLGTYEKAATGFAVKGTEITLSQSDAKSPNRGTVDVTGASAAAIDRIAFNLPITDDGDAATAKKRQTDIIRTVLFHFGLKDEGMLDAIDKEQNADGLIDGTPVAVAVTSETPRRIIVTMTRPTAPASADTAVQNTQQP